MRACVFVCGGGGGGACVRACVCEHGIQWLNNGLFYN